MADTIIQSETLERTANAIRTALNSDEKINPLNFENKINDVYEAGKNSEHETFWSVYTADGTRTYWRYGFAEQGWIDEIFNPPEGLVKPSDARAMFQNSFITKVTKKQVDFSSATSLRDTFNSSKLVECEMSAVKCANLYTTFNACDLLEILSLDVSEITRYNNAFSGCTALRNLIINGTIALNGFSLENSTLLSRDSIRSVFNALSLDTSGLSITFSKIAVNNAFGIDVDDESTYPEGSEYYELRHSRDNWTINYI